MKGLHKNIVPFNGTNYFDWKCRMTILLKQQKVLKVVTDKIPLVLMGRKKKRMIEKDDLAQSIIMNFVDDQKLSLIRNKERAYDMWQALTEMYEKKGMPGKLALQRQMQALKLAENGSMRDFLHEYEVLVDQYRASGASLSDETVIGQVLLNLPQSSQSARYVYSTVELGTCNTRLN